MIKERFKKEIILIFYRCLFSWHIQYLWTILKFKWISGFNRRHDKLQWKQTDID